MLPPAAALLNRGDAFDLFARTLPARDVGGDFYDYFLLDDRRIAITIGDVSGKGIPAALFMAATQTALRVALRQQQTLDAAIAAANNLLVANNDEVMFATLPRRRCAFSALAAAICKNSAAKTRDFLPR